MIYFKAASYYQINIRYLQHSLFFLKSGFTLKNSMLSIACQGLWPLGVRFWLKIFQAHIQKSFEMLYLATHPLAKHKGMEYASSCSHDAINTINKTFRVDSISFIKYLGATIINKYDTFFAALEKDFCSFFRRHLC